jgi:V8-like Glu-specific endopeptidase
MKKFLSIMVLSILTVTSGSCKPVSPVKSAHDASYHISFVTVTDGDMCTATAIGPHALLTATHCELPTDDVVIAVQNDTDDNDDIGHIVKRIRDKADHTILFISGQSFPSWVSVNLDDPLEQNENVFSIGNPAEWTDVFYRGYIQGTQVDHSLEAAFGLGTPDEVLLDIQVWHGDSGAGVFNDKGELIGVLTGMDHPAKDAPSAAFMYKMAFTADQIAEAVKFTAPGFVPPPKKDKNSDDKDDKDDSK